MSRERRPYKPPELRPLSALDVAELERRFGIEPGKLAEEFPRSEEPPPAPSQKRAF